VYTVGAMLSDQQSHYVGLLVRLHKNQTTMISIRLELLHDTVKVHVNTLGGCQRCKYHIVVVLLPCLMEISAKFRNKSSTVHCQ